MRFTTEEYRDMYLIFTECGRNARLSVQRYAEVYGGVRVIPSFTTFLRLDQRFRETGNVACRRVKGRNNYERKNLHDEELVLDKVWQDPTTSARKMEAELDIPKSNINRITRKNGLHPYHYRNVQVIEDTDFSKRRKFCRWILENPEKLPFILWTDECLFTREGMFNTHNEHFYDEENPYVIRERKTQKRFKINVWAGVIGNKLLGPYWLPDYLNGDRYLIFLQGVLPQLLEDLDLETRRRLIFMHDGCPAHRTAPVVEHLNQTFGANWIGYKAQNGIHTQWPPRFPEMTPVDFWLWGDIKRLVYSTPLPRNEQEAEREMIARLHAAFEIITPNMVQKTTQSVLKRARKCLEVRGRHFQQLLKH